MQFENGKARAVAHSGPFSFVLCKLLHKILVIFEVIYNH